MNYENILQPEGELETTLRVSLMGVAAGYPQSLPTYGGAVHWTGRVDNDTLFLVIHWPTNNLLLEVIRRSLADCDCRPIVIVMHDLNDMPPDSILAQAFVSWPLNGTLEAALLCLVTSILVPAAYKGLICIDYADYAAVLKGGTFVRVFHGVHWDFQIALNKLLEETAKPLASLAEHDAVCIHVSVPLDNLEWYCIDEIGRAIESQVPEQMVIIIALTGHQEDVVELSLLTVAGRSTSPRRKGSR